MDSSFDALMSAYKGAQDTDGMMCYACDAAPKKPQTLQQHLQRYHKGQMPKGDCSWLKQYKKDHPDWQSEVPTATKGESDIDTVKKDAKGSVKKVKMSKKDIMNAIRNGKYRRKGAKKGYAEEYVDTVKKDAKKKTAKSESEGKTNKFASMSWDSAKSILVEQAPYIFSEKKNGYGFDESDLQEDWEDAIKYGDDISPRAFAFTQFINHSYGFNQTKLRKDDEWVHYHTNHSVDEVCRTLGFESDYKKTESLNKELDLLDLPQDIKDNFIGCFKDLETGKDVAFYYVEEDSA